MQIVRRKTCLFCRYCSLFNTIGATCWHPQHKNYHNDGMTSSQKSTSTNSNACTDFEIRQLEKNCIFCLAFKDCTKTGWFWFWHDPCKDMIAPAVRCYICGEKHNISEYTVCKDDPEKEPLFKALLCQCCVDRGPEFILSENQNIKKQWGELSEKNRIENCKKREEKERFSKEVRELLKSTQEKFTLTT